jgi:ribose 1,5-bisphosphate isomerase
MSEHPAIKTVVERIHADAIGGAADIAKEVVGALAQLSEDSSATDSGAFVADIMDAVKDILSVTPSFAPPINAMHRLLGRVEAANKSGASVAELQAEIKGGSDDFFAWAEDALDRIAQYGAEKISDGDVVFMYSMSSTVWRIFKKAKAAGKSFEVIVTESRPGNEGLWTVNEMHNNGIPVSVSIDANIGELVPRSNAVFVGADAISSDGVSFVKVGTYPTALVAQAHGVPFYVAADSLKFDSSTLLGLPFRGEPISRGDLLSDEYPAEVDVVGDLFEPVPPDLVTALITELGLLSPTAVVSVMWQMKLSDSLNELIPAWARGELRSHD